MVDYAQWEAAEGVRFVWNAWPASRYVGPSRTLVSSNMTRHICSSFGAWSVWSLVAPSRALQSAVGIHRDPLVPRSLPHLA